MPNIAHAFCARSFIVVVALERSRIADSSSPCSLAPSMNGLRYHYQHSGAHGALGLQMLAQGCHPPPQFPPGHKRGHGSSSHQLSHSYTPGSASSSRASSPAGIMRGIGRDSY